jgi:hypothetical protein
MLFGPHEPTPLSCEFVGKKCDFFLSVFKNTEKPFLLKTKTLPGPLSKLTILSRFLQKLPKKQTYDPMSKETSNSHGQDSSLQL